MEDRIRICFVCISFWPMIGGAQRHAERHARQLQALGHEVTIVTLRHKRWWKRTESLDGLAIVRVGGLYRTEKGLRVGKLGFLPLSIGLFLTLWRLRHHYDILHAFQLTPPAPVAVLVGKITQKPVILNISSHGPSNKPGFGPGNKPDTQPHLGDINGIYDRSLGGDAIVNFLRKSNAFYQVLSSRSISYLTSHGFRAEQIVRIPNGVDTETFRPAAERGFDAEKPARDLICVARLEHAKGIDVLLHAWGRLMHEPADWQTYLKPRLRLVGAGSYRPQLECLVTELGIQHSVEFLGERTEIIDLLQHAWGFILPSRWEGMSNALLEAMACGLPCVSTRVSGSEDIISDGVNGLLVEPEQPAEMAQALCRIITDADLAQRLGQNGRATVLGEYQLSAVVEQCLQLYHRLLTKEEKNL
jgi:glycosyltransferase involved in cell wall biosynthesis